MDILICKEPFSSMNTLYLGMGKHGFQPYSSAPSGVKFKADLGGKIEIISHDGPTSWGIYVAYPDRDNGYGEQESIRNNSDI